MATKKTTKKATTKKVVSKKPVAKKTAAKKTTQKKDTHEMAYFWGGLLIALCGAGAFVVFAFGIGMML
jgi:hypothetical protein